MPVCETGRFAVRLAAPEQNQQALPAFPFPARCHFLQGPAQYAFQRYDRETVFKPGRYSSAVFILSVCTIWINFITHPLNLLIPARQFTEPTDKLFFMRKIAPLPFLLILFLVRSFPAQGQREVWAKADNFSAIAVDSLGNLLATRANTLTKFDTSGNVIWSQTFSANFGSLCCTPDGSIYATASGKIVKFSFNGQLIWEVTGSGGQITAGTNNAIYVGSVFSFTRYSADGVAQFTKTLNLNGTYMVGFSTISADKSGNIHLNFFYLFQVYMDPSNPFFPGVTGNIRLVFDSTGSQKMAQGSMGANAARNYARGYKAKDNANSFVYTSFFSSLNSVARMGYLNDCPISGTCLTGNPVNPDFDKYGKNYFAGVMEVNNLPNPCSTSQDIDICNRNTTGKLNKIFVSLGGPVLTTLNDGNTQEAPSWIAADPNGRSLYLLGSWSKLASDSKFTFGSSELTSPGTMILRYGLNDPAATPLPVTNLYLSGRTLNNRNVLAWTTTSEENNDRFELERSADGNLFATIGLVKSKALNGNSTAPLSYVLADNNLMQGIAYYRLKQIDRNGRSVYSNTVALKYSAESDVFVYPNPARGVLKLVANATHPDVGVVSVFDGIGREVMQKKISFVAGVNHTAFDVRALTPGRYFMRVMFASAGKSETVQFMRE